MLKKILLIQNNHDDDSKIQEILENAGYITYITAGEFDGLKIAERYPADAIVCELDDFEKELKLPKDYKERYKEKLEEAKRIIEDAGISLISDSL